jgi:hypothetical protein
MKGGLGRRQFLLAAGGAMALLGSGAAVGLYRSDYPLRRWIARIVRTHLPGVPIDDAVLGAYIDDVLAEDPSQKIVTRLAALANLVAPGIHRLDDRLRGPVEDFERWVLSGFLLQSNFFRVEDPYQDEIEYIGKTVCDNPFASLG